jgi:hypothetical protein
VLKAAEALLSESFSMLATSHLKQCTRWIARLDCIAAPDEIFEMPLGVPMARLRRAAIASGCRCGGSQNGRFTPMLPTPVSHDAQALLCNNACNIFLVIHVPTPSLPYSTFFKTFIFADVSACSCREFSCDSNTETAPGDVPARLTFAPLSSFHFTSLTGALAIRRFRRLRFCRPVSCGRQFCLELASPFALELKN